MNRKKMLISLATALLLQGTINQITAASLYPSDKSEKSNKEVRKSSKGFLFFKKKQKEEEKPAPPLSLQDNDRPRLLVDVWCDECHPKR